MTLRQLLAEGTTGLEASGISEADANAEYLAAHVLQFDRRSELRSNGSMEISPDDVNLFRTLIERRKNREPLQYILGEWEFYGIPLRVTPYVLIPRPETEILVEETLRESGRFSGEIAILDIGTGSGAIALALAVHLPAATIYAMDTSEAAIALAKRNADRLAIKNILFFQANVFDDEWITKFAGRINLLVSNPPYVSAHEFESLEPELRLYEPREALTDNATGLTYYKRIAEIAPLLLSNDGQLLLELGFGQAAAVRKIVEECDLRVERIAADLAEIDRVLIAAR